MTNSSVRRRRLLGLALCGSVCTIAPCSLAQSRDAVIRVHVADSARHPIARVAIDVMRGEKSLMRVSTDSVGAQAFRLHDADGEYRFVFRKIGYQPVERLLPVRGGDTASIDVVLQAVAVVLGPVEVSAEASPKAKAYHITAQDVVAYNRPVYSAYDILRKMRPDMLTSRTPEICEQPANSEPAVSKIVVNGKRIPIDKPISMTRRGSVIDADSVKSQVATILGEIRPEDVDEITFLDCLDSPRDNLVTRDALYVVLKRGVAYEYGRGSYVRRSSNSKGPVGPVPPSAKTLRSQTRLIGVFDRLTAEPLAGVSITDQITALTVTTTVTGTALVRRTSSPGYALRLAKAGYRDTTIVTVAGDTLPITALMTKKP